MNSIIHVQDKRLKEGFHSIPSLDELRALEAEGYRNDVILVETGRDKKLSMLKQLILTLVKGFRSNPAAIIRKIAGLVRSILVVIFLAHSPNLNFATVSPLNFTAFPFKNRERVFRLLITFTMRSSGDADEVKKIELTSNYSIFFSFLFTLPRNS